MMMKYDDITVMKVISTCFKPFLKPEEAMIFCNPGHTQLTKKCEEHEVYKNLNGYYKREDLGLILSGALSRIIEMAKMIKL
jgi:hypothetical protein